MSERCRWGGALPRGSGLCPVPDFASPGPGNTLTRPSVPPPFAFLQPPARQPIFLGTSEHSWGGAPFPGAGLGSPSQEPRAPLFSTFGDDEIPGGLAQPLLAPPKSQGPWLTAQGTCDLTDKLGWSRS